MRAPFVLASVLALSACLSPQEQCISEATRELRVIGQLVRETEGNLARGYALETVQEVRVIRATCEGENEDGTTFTFECEETRTFNQQRRVAIDLNAEAAKLASLRERQALLQRQADGAVTQCQALYPE